MNNTYTPQTHRKLMVHEDVMAYIAEAKKVNYKIKGNLKKGNFEVITDECEQHPAGEIVFKGFRPSTKSVWMIKFNPEYWEND